MVTPLAPQHLPQGGKKVKLAQRLVHLVMAPAAPLADEHGMVGVYRFRRDAVAAAMRVEDDLIASLFTEESHTNPKLARYWNKAGTALREKRCHRHRQRLLAEFNAKFLPVIIDAPLDENFEPSSDDEDEDGDENDADDEDDDDDEEEDEGGDKGDDDSSFHSDDAAESSSSSSSALSFVSSSDDQSANEEGEEKEEKDKE